MKETFRNS